MRPDWCQAPGGKSSCAGWKWRRADGRTPQGARGKSVQARRMRLACVMEPLIARFGRSVKGVSARPAPMRAGCGRWHPRIGHRLHRVALSGRAHVSEAGIVLVDLRPPGSCARQHVPRHRTSRQRARCQADDVRRPAPDAACQATHLRSAAAPRHDPTVRQPMRLPPLPPLAKRRARRRGNFRFPLGSRRRARCAKGRSRR